MKYIQTVVVLREEFPPFFDGEVTEESLDAHAERVSGIIADKFDNDVFPFTVEAVTTVEEE